MPHLAYGIETKAGFPHALARDCPAEGARWKALAASWADTPTPDGKRILAVLDVHLKMETTISTFFLEIYSMLPYL